MRLTGLALPSSVKLWTGIVNHKELAPAR